MVAERYGQTLINKKRAMWTAAVAVFFIAAALTIIGRIANFDKIDHELGQADKWWFLLCLAGELLAYQGYVFAYRDFARANRGPRLSWWQTIRIVYIGQGASILGATAAGLAVDFWALTISGANKHESARRVLGLNTMQWASMAALAMVASIFILAGVDHRVPIGMAISWLIVPPLCFIAARWFTDRKRLAKYSGYLDSASEINWRNPEGWPGWAWSNLKKSFADAIGGVALVRHVMSHPRYYKFGISGFFFYWIGHMACLEGAALAFGYFINPASLVLVYATTFLLTILPLPAGGAGGIEATLSFILNLVGLPLATAVSAMLVFRFFTFWLPIAPALILMSRVKELREELSHNRRDKWTPRTKVNRAF